MTLDGITAWFSRNIVRHLVDREGPPRVGLYKDLLASQWQPREALDRLQRQRLSTLLEHATGSVPYYREAYRDLSQSLDEDAVTTLQRLPILSKGTVQSRKQDLISSAVPGHDLRTAKTGGSTGTSLTVHFDVACEAHRVAAAWRSDGWAGWEFGALRAALWGSPPIAHTMRQRLRAILYDRTFYLDTINLSPESMLAFYETYQRRTPPVLFGHSHSLYILARFLADRGLTPAPPVGIISTSMMLMQNERAAIERTFSARVFNRYGCEEVGLIAAECDAHQGLHVNAEHVIVELLDDDGHAVAPGDTGRVVVTDLMNRGMPLIRYEVGDLAVWSGDSCRCGRALPLVSHIVGRTADFLVRPDGGLVAGVSLIEKTLTALSGLLQMQLEQNELLVIDVRIVTGGSFGEAEESQLRQELTSAFGQQTQFRIQRVDAIARTGRGKYRFSIRNIPLPE